MPVFYKLNWKWILSYLRRIAPGVFCVFLFLFCAVTYIHNTDGRQPVPKNQLELYNFRYLIQNDICEEDPYLLVLVHSAVNHFEHRNVIRNTWGNPGMDIPSIKVVFLLGTTNKFQKEIVKENEIHRDIIQGDFLDSYHNLTYKHTMGLSWASSFCNRTKYLMKMDDDIFVDIYQFYDYIANRVRILDLRNNIACYFQTGMPVVRDSVSKWFVSKKEYAQDTFNDYCSGWAYLTTTYVAHRLYEAAKKLPYFWVDDVHLTGTAAKLAKVGQIRMNPLFDLESEGLMVWTRSSVNLKWNKVFAPTWGDLALSRRAHKKAYMCYKTKCNCCYKPPTTPKPTTTSTTRKGFAQLIRFPHH
ncbi:lactosylceramide 1,3-N-acetyl-beta-D-glucosaminyltransferase [Nephila pilipes]|uniref:Hexosyltransferase n=1 Tax=Nephila pilipes TaxID=299642 RepID=A0A8X6R537_NEPPI|nr:lactosylceramide 1,3-N-acetyl-beta-D-glucosaminyltransferase [Nephila pilipes]